MTWLILALISALSFTVVDLLSKSALRSDSVVMVIFIKMVTSAPFLLPILFFIPIPSLSVAFWKVLAFVIPLEITAHLFYMHAINRAPLSLTVPFLSLTPVAALLVSWIILAETPSLFGVLGVLAVGIGAYLINIDKRKYGILAPFTALFRERGILFMLLAALTFSFTATLGKKLILLSSPLFFAATYFPLVGICYSLLFFKSLRKNSSLITLNKRIYLYLLIGIFWALMTVTHYLAISRIEVAYFVSVKRLSLLFSTIGGIIFFHETNPGERISGVVLMLIGVVLISLLG